MAEPDLMPTGIQMRRPDIAYFTREQIYKGREGVKVVWNIVPDHEIVYVYTSRKSVKICTDDDVCSAASVLPEFDIKVSEKFVIPANA